MLRLSTKGRYAARMMLYLCRHAEKMGASKEKIAKAEEISAQYAEQILTKLRIAGLITTKRGRHGGYTLSCEPASTTLADILQAVEGKLALVPCLTSNGCPRRQRCAMHPVWSEINTSVLRLLAQTTLQQVAERARETTPLDGFSFDI